MPGVPDSVSLSPPAPRRTLEAGATAVLAVALGIGLAVVIDLGGPRGEGGKLATTAASALAATDLAARMEAQIAAGAPGVALALERSAPESSRNSAAVSVAHARAEFELGDAPSALRTVRMAIRICEVGGRCSPGERAQLARAEVVFGAVVGAGVDDPRRDPKRVDEALHGLFQGASFAK